MRPTHLLLCLVALVAVTHGAVKVTSRCPAKINGRMTGQLAAKIEESHARVKRQGRRDPRPPRPRPQGPQNPAPAPATPATPIAPPAPEPSTTAPPITTTEAVTTVATPEPCEGVSPFYRTADGTCNNLNNPDWGSVGMPFQRLLPPAYSFENGNNAPRLFKTNGLDLPSARTVSATIHTPQPDPVDRRSPVILMQWGQFLDHDITGTAAADIPNDLSCCSNDLVNNNQRHSDVSTGGPCFPIIVAAGDRHFQTTEDRCMEFTRSYRTVPEGRTDEEQINLLTAYIDASNVYDTSDDAMAALRAPNGGRLLEGNTDFLPPGNDSDCTLDGADDYCFKAGDSRSNVFPGLGALHTVFLREHNRIADQLGASNPDWDSDRIFKETRKIVGALMQHITYNEYLPVILGPDAMTDYELTPNGVYEYNPNINPTVSSVFSTAAFRFGHSQVPAVIVVGGAAVSIQDIYNRPGLVLNSLRELVQGLLRQPAREADRWYTTGMTDFLFEEADGSSQDIVSLNVQRGRDHGIQPYNNWREFCGLNRLTAFAELPDGNVFQRAYSPPGQPGSVDDIDLYSGGLNEDSVPGGSVGETYACLLGLQFRALKFGDRFWYENSGDTGFTAAQLAEIKKMTLSRVLCNAFNDQLGQVQPNAFLDRDEEGNAPVQCNTLENMDLSVW